MAGSWKMSLIYHFQGNNYEERLTEAILDRKVSPSECMDNKIGQLFDQVSKSQAIRSGDFILKIVCIHKQSGEAYQMLNTALDVLDTALKSMTKMVDVTPSKTVSLKWTDSIVSR